MADPKNLVREEKATVTDGFTIVPHDGYEVVEVRVEQPEIFDKRMVLYKVVVARKDD